MVSKFDYKELFSIHSISIINTILSFFIVRILLNYQSELFYTNWTTVLKSILILPILLEFKIKDVVKNDIRGNSIFSIFIIAQIIVVFYVIDDFNLHAISSCLLLGLFVTIHKLVFENCLLKHGVSLFILSTFIRQLSIVFLFYKFKIEIWNGIYFYSLLYLIEIIFVTSIYKLPPKILTKILSNSFKFKLKDLYLILISISGAIYQLHLLSTIKSHVDSVIILLLIQLSLIYSQFGNSINQLTYKYGIINKYSSFFQIFIGIGIYFFMIFFGKSFIEFTFNITLLDSKISYYSLVIIYFIIRFIYNNTIYKSLSNKKYIVGIIPLLEAILFVGLIFLSFEILTSMFIAMLFPLILYNLLPKYLT